MFTDVVNCMQTENLELKKLVYLYLMNYAKSQSDTAIISVNTFVKVQAHWKPCMLSLYAVCVCVCVCEHVCVCVCVFMGKRMNRQMVY